MLSTTKPNEGMCIYYQDQEFSRLIINFITMEILRQVRKYLPVNPLTTGNILGKTWITMLIGAGILGTTLILCQSLLLQEYITEAGKFHLTWFTLGVAMLVGAMATKFANSADINPDSDANSAVDPFTPTPPQCEPFIQQRERFFSLSLDLLCIASFEGYFQWVNPAFVTTLGYTEAELLSVPLSEFVHPDDRDATKAELEQIAQGKPAFNFENRYRCRDGSYRWLSWTAAPFVEEGLLYAVARDVTEYKRSVAQLQSRIEQQAAVAWLGQYALSQTNLEELLGKITTLVAQTLNVQFVNILELLPHGHALLLKAGVGWSSGLVGYARISAGSQSHAGYTLAQKQPVVVEDLRVETRFTGEPMLHNHRIVSGMSVIIGEEDQPYGVLSVYTSTQRTFTTDDLNFAQAIANIIATAIARKQSTDSLYLMERAINASSNGIIITDATEADNPIIYVNAGFERITGYSREEVIEQNCRFLQGPQTDSSQVERLRTAILQGRECRVVIQNYRRDGSLFWNDLQVAPVFNDRGHLTHFIGVQNDITERYEAQEEVRQTRNFLQTMIDHLPVAVFVKQTSPDEDFGRFRLWNKACEQLFGLSEDRVLGKTVYDVFPPSQAECFDQQDRAVLETGRVLDIPEEQVETPTVGRRILHTVKVPLRDRNDDTEYLICIGEDITQRKQAEEQLRHHAFYDTLTDLPNRALFLDRLAQVLKRVQQGFGKWFAVLFLDLDNFKRVNDSLGHEIGDQLLIAIARRLEGCLRPGDTLARLGGDEFTILLEPVGGVTDAIEVARLVHQQLILPFNLKGNEVFTNASIGIALSGASCERPEDLLRNADLAMYRAKEMGKGAYAVFDTKMHRKAVERLQLESQLRRALELEEFQVHYQPIVSIPTGEVMGFEALIRWLNPYKGLISPGLFIPVAEETGLIGQIGEWVLYQACQQLQLWRLEFPQLQELTVSVNLSSQQLREPDLLEQIDRILAQTGLPSSCLKLEITESLLIENSETALKILRQIRERNICLSLDDFGTGYSSLSYLHRFPIDTLKIDRSFVRRLRENHDNTAIVKAILRLAHALEMNAIAEGIETVFQLEKLKSLGCECGQGNLFSEALEARNVPHFLGAIIR
ncbi:EAL domain-containing protein [Capilliphycus salinus ALCB114379]|uniref:EAL domain-containing protein n=1 Tax=Capilliphycus salinus TaxID=2768948 RepID=UPI0039A53E1B